MLNRTPRATMRELRTLQDILPGLEGRGGRPAVISCRHDGERILAYRELFDRGLRLAEGMRLNGIGRGARVGIYAPTIAEAVIVHVAVIALGAVAVNFGGEMSGMALREAIEQTDCSALFTTRELLAKEGGAGDMAPPVYRLDGDGEEDSWSRLLEHVRVQPAAVAAVDVAAIFFTSGTTGPPKHVPLTHANLTSALNAFLSMGVATPEDRVLLPLPLYHVYPLIVGLLVPLASGAAVVLPEGLGPGQIRSALGGSRATIVVGVPRLFEALLSGIDGRARAAGRPAHAAFTALLGFSSAARRWLGLRLGRTLFLRVHGQLAPCLRLLISGGAKLELRVARGLEGLGWQVLSGYGLAETAALGAFNAPGTGRLGTAGRAAAGVSIRIDAPDAAGVGEILIRGPNVFTGYPGREGATEAAFTKDGWFRSGDLGSLGADGYLRIEGRTKEIIVLADGKNIAPEPLEKTYAASPYVAELGILERGGLLHAVVVPDLDQVRRAPSARIDDVIRVALGERAHRLPSHHRLSGFVLTTEPLPRTPLGKLRRFLLSDIYEGGTAAVAPGEAELDPEDRALLADPQAEALWTWLNERFPGRPISLDSNPQLDLGVDSLAWVGLGMEIEQTLGIRLSEEAIAGAVTLRDLLVFVAGGRDAEAEELEQALADKDGWLPRDTVLRRAASPIVYGLVWPVVRLLTRLKIQGVARVPESGPVVIVANHASYLDPFVLGMALKYRRLRRGAWATSAEYLLAAPAVIRWLAGLARAFPVTDRAPKASLALAQVVLEEERILVWFPEAWRTSDGALQPFLPGIGRVLQGRDLRVIPAYIDGTFEAWPRTQRFPRLGRVKVRFGEPIQVGALERMGEGDTPETRVAEALQDAVAGLRQSS